MSQLASISLVWKPGVQPQVSGPVLKTPKLQCSETETLCLPEQIGSSQAVAGQAAAWHLAAPAPPAELRRS